jgi:hypothetical protein
VTPWKSFEWHGHVIGRDHRRAESQVELELVEFATDAAIDDEPRRPQQVFECVEKGVDITSRCFPVVVVEVVSERCDSLLQAGSLRRASSHRWQRA